MADVVRLKNDSERDLRITFNSESTVVPKKSEGFIDREAAYVYFGNPAIRNQPGAKYREDELARQSEYERVRALWVPLGDGVERTDNAMLPKVEIYELTGEKWTTILDDPEGKDLPVIGASEMDKEKVLQSLQEQIERLTEQMSKEAAQPVAVGEDTPRPPKQRRPISAIAADDD